MGNDDNQQSLEKYPFVSICTPTFNRRPFIENMFTCFRNQDYPKHRASRFLSSVQYAH